MAKLNVCVKSSLTGESICSLSLDKKLDAHLTVAGLKENIHSRAGIPPQEQCLMLGNQRLKNGVVLGDDLDLFDTTSEQVDVHLVRTGPEHNPEFRKRRFQDNYTDFGFASSKDRWAYHHSQKANCDTDLTRGMGGKHRLYVTLRRDAQRAATFNLCSFDFPLSELFDTFAEQMGLPIVELQFFFQGLLLTREHTPHLCGMESCSKENPYVIDVIPAGGQRTRRKLLAVLNDMGNAVDLLPRSLVTHRSVLGADIWLRVFYALPLGDLLNTTLASTFWFHATQRLSLMLQLRHGDVAFGKAPPEEYKTWLTSVFGHSQQLALVEAQARHNELKVWQSLNMSKERQKRPAYNFTKAAGCTMMKTVSMSGLSAEFEQQWLSLHSCKSNFMADCKTWCKEQGQVQEICEEKLEQKQEQELPPPECDFFITDAVGPQFHANAIEIFRKYFSPDMYFIFPLIVGRQAAFGLDFCATTTTLFFGPQSSLVSNAGSRKDKLGQLSLGDGGLGRHAFVNESVRAPVGACSWRFRWPLLAGAMVSGAPKIEQPSSLLEILFIAVWEEKRYQVHGGTLVEELEARARKAGVKMMYVEIGFEQPKARRFWRKQGFKRVARLGANAEERQQLEEAAQEDEVVVPFVYLSDAQLDFFESNCLRFGDTAQYVKLLE